MRDEHINAQLIELEQVVAFMRSEGIYVPAIDPRLVKAAQERGFGEGAICNG